MSAGIGPPSEGRLRNIVGIVSDVRHQTRRIVTLSISRSVHALVADSCPLVVSQGVKSADDRISPSGELALPNGLDVCLRLLPAMTAVAFTNAPDEGDWNVEENGRVLSKHRTEGEAINCGREVAKRDDGVFVVHGHNGRIREKDSWQRPLPAKGGREGRNAT